MREVVDGVFELRVGFVNVHIVLTDDGVVLVDTGLPGRAPKVARALGEARKAIGDVTTILLTHWHDDHTGGLAELRRRSGATVVAHAIDAPVITGAETIAPTRFQRVTGLFLKPAERAPVDDVLTGDGPIDLPGFRAFHTPGHTAGHVSFLLDRGDGVLFAGDAAAGAAAGSARRRR